MRAVGGSFQGRRRELARLQAALDEVRGGHAATVALVTGDAGIGKTRLVAELAAEAQNLGVQVLSGHCLDVDADALPYAPFVELLTALVERDGVGEVAALAGRTAFELARLAPALAPHGALPAASTGSRAGLYLAMSSLVEGLARQRPLLLVVEDVHWADAASRDLLTLLCHRVGGRVLMVLTTRGDEPAQTPDHRRFLLQLQRAAALQMTLPPLSREEQARQISDLHGVPPSSALVDEIYARTDGNPLFAEELLALGTAGQLPDTVRDLFLARLDAMNATTVQVLRLAATIGAEVTHRLLVAAADVSGAELEHAMQRAVDARLLLVGPTGTSYRFRHALLREAVAQTVLPGEAMRWHRRLAELLTDDPHLVDDAPHRLAGLVARHWEAAGDPARTLRASVRAAADAQASLAFAEADLHYRRAVDLLDRLPDADALLPMPRYRLLWSAAVAAHLAAYPQRAADLIRAAIAVVDPEQEHHRAYLHERLGRFLWMSADGAGAMQAYERAVELVPTSPVTCWQAAIVSGYSQILMLTGRYVEAREQASTAIVLSKGQSGGRAVEGHARNNLGVALAHLGEVDDGITQLRLAWRIAEEEFEDVDDVARAVVNLHAVLHDAGRYEEAAEVAVDGIALADRLGLVRRKGVWCRCDAAESLLVLGRAEEALRFVDEALGLEPDGIDEVRTSLVRGLALLRCGRLEEAGTTLEACRQLAARVTDPQLVGPLYEGLVDLARWNGAAERAVGFASEGADRLAEDDDATFVLPFLAGAVGAAADAGRPLRAWADRLESLATAGPMLPPAEASLALARAEQARAQGCDTPANWRAVAEQWSRLGDRYQAAYAGWREAEAHLRTRARTVTRSAAEAARREAEAVGAAHLVRAVDGLLARLGGQATAVREPLPFRLTPREAQVLGLVAVGRSDREVAAELFISHRTVERHVSNILAKLSASSRSQATAIARGQGLLS